MTEHSRKMLLGFEAAGDCDVEYARLGRAQHLLRTLYSVAQYKLVRRLARRLAKHPGEMSWAQLHRLRHLPKSQLVFYLGMHQLCNHSQACRTESASQRPHGAALTCIGIDQCGGNCLLDGLQKQSPTRKARNSFSIYCLDQRSQSYVNHFARVAEFNRAAYSLAGGP